jgi:hypothetical protein
LPDDRYPIGHPQPGRSCGGRSNVGQDNIAGPNEILHTLPETVLSQLVADAHKALTLLAAWW